MIGIICFWDRLATPYLSKYEHILDELRYEYQVVFWNRAGIGEDAVQEENEYVSITSRCTGNRIQKMRAFFRWGRLATKLIKRKKYDNLIILSTMPAVLLSQLLLREYKGRYIFDIRDYTFEKNTLFKRLVMSLIRASAMTTISSKGYMQWLDDDPKIKVNHNITAKCCLKESMLVRGQRLIRFGFVGNVRLDAQTEALMLKMGQYDKIEQHFYGRILPDCNIKQLVSVNSINNVILHGAFETEDKEQIYHDIDLINCVYANAKKEEDIRLDDSTPLPNRLYDAIAFKKPIVASKGTYLAELVEQYNLGCTINGFDDEAVDVICEYIDHFDKGLFEKGTEALKAIVDHEEKEYLVELKRVLTAWVNK